MKSLLILLLCASTVSAQNTQSVKRGGTGKTSLTAYGVVTGGTTSTGAMQSVAVGTSGQVLTSNGAGASPTMQGVPHVIVVSLDGQGTAIQTGSHGWITSPYAGTISKWYIVGDVSGSIVVDLKRSGASIIGGGNLPTLTSATSANAAVSGWTSTAVAVGDIFNFNVNSCTTTTFCQVVILFQ